MRWNLKYAIRSYISGSMWLVPVFAVLFYMVFHRITYAIGAWLLQTRRPDETNAFRMSGCSHAPTAMNR